MCGTGVCGTGVCGTGTVTYQVASACGVEVASTSRWNLWWAMSVLPSPKFVPLTWGGART